MQQTDLLNEIRNTQSLSPKARREVLLPHATSTELSRAFNQLAAGVEVRAISRALSDLASDKLRRNTMRRLASIHAEELVGLLKTDDAKARKNLAEFYGKLDADKFYPALRALYLRETVDFVKPSILLAIGNAKGTPEALPFLESISLPDSLDADKNIRAQHTALQKAVTQLAPKGAIKKPLEPLHEPMDFMLTCPNLKITLEELTALGIQAKPLDAKNRLVLVESLASIKALYRARTFYDAGIYVGSFPAIKNAANKVTGRVLLPLINTLYGTQALSYRIELKGERIPNKLRLLCYGQIEERLSDTKLTNNPANYDFEIRLTEVGKHVHLGLFPGSDLDERFSYRKSTISASIHPVVAASCIQFIKPFLKEGATVLDPFCGSGTMLFARSQFPHATLEGSDISRTALKAANENLEYSQTQTLRFFRKDATTPFLKQYSEVLSNMPFGLRVSNHRENKALYQSFLANLAGILKEDGSAFLFTNEKKLLLELLPEQFRIVDKATFAAGGLYPSMFVIKQIAS